MAIGATEAGCLRLPSTHSVPISHSLSLSLKAVFFLVVGREGHTAKLGCVRAGGWWGCVEVKAPLGSGEENGGWRGDQGPPGGGLPSTLVGMGLG